MQDQKKLYDLYFQRTNPSWGQQFINAVTLGPALDEEEVDLGEVSAWDAFSHFCAIFWKVVFATIPPKDM